MGRFGSEPRSEPKPDQTEHQFRVRVQLLTRTGPMVPFRVQRNPEIVERVLNAFEREPNANRLYYQDKILGTQKIIGTLVFK